MFGSRSHAALLLGILVALAAVAARGPDRPGRDSQPEGAAMSLPIVEWSGADGHIKAPEFVRITEPAAWLDLWLRHTGSEVPDDARWSVQHPKIDFDRYMVVAVIRGETTNTRGERMEGWSISEDRCLVRYDSASYQTASFDGKPDPGSRAVSFGIWVLPKTAAQIVFEENVQGMQDKHPIWKERHRIP